MLRRHDNAGMNARPWYTWRDASKINDKLGGGVSDYGEIGINSLCLFFTKFNLELLLEWRLGWIVFWHDILVDNFLLDIYTWCLVLVNVLVV